MMINKFLCGNKNIKTQKFAANRNKEVNYTLQSILFNFINFWASFHYSHIAQANAIALSTDFNFNSCVEIDRHEKNKSEHV